ncbi:MAG: PstS family phosphate ABC transporter substrate-binding protein [bacterium]
MKHFRNLALGFALLLMVGFAAGCGNSGGGGQSDQLSGEVNIAGSSTVYPIATAVSEEFQKKHPNVSVSVSSTGSGGGFSNFFCPGKTDLNNASRPIKDEEMNQCQKNGVQPIEFQVAIDALTVVTNKENPVDCMTTDELKQIWKPNGADRWNQVNSDWPNAEFELYGAASTSGTFDYFTEAIMHEEGSHRSDYSATEHDNTIVQGVSGSKYALGYFGYAYYKQNKNKVKAVAIDNGNGCVKPSLETAKSGKYKPLSRPLFTYVAKRRLSKDRVKAFTKSFIKRAGTDLVSQIGYVPVTEDIVQNNLDKLERVSP